MSARRRASTRNKMKTMDNHDDFLRRITKSLYYGKLPTIPCLSLPVMELSADIFSESQKGKSLKRLYLEDAAELTRNACVSPCSLVLALVYLERLKSCNPEYVEKMAPADLFLVSLMVSNKFLQDDGEDDEVVSDEWAASAGVTPLALNQMERKFLHAIDWRVFVSEANFDSTLEWLEQQVAQRQGKLRGWFTYADLTTITNASENIGLAKCLATVYTALSISYLASVCTLMASSLIVSHGLAAMSMSNGLINAFESPAGYHNERLGNFTVPSDLDSLKNKYDYSNSYLNQIDNVLNFNSDFIDDDTNNSTLYPKIKYHIDSFKPLYLSFLRKIIQSTFASHHDHDPKEISYFDRNINKNIGRYDCEMLQNNRNSCNENIFSIRHFQLWSPAVSC